MEIFCPFGFLGTLGWENSSEVPRNPNGQNISILIFKYQKNAVTTVYIFPPIFLKAWVAHLNAICCMFGSVT